MPCVELAKDDGAAAEGDTDGGAAAAFASSWLEMEFRLLMAKMILVQQKMNRVKGMMYCVTVDNIPYTI